MSEHKKSFFEENKAVLLIALIGLAVVAAGFAFLSRQGEGAPGSSQNPFSGGAGGNQSVGGSVSLTENAVPLELFVMSQCPYGVQAELSVMPVIKKFEGAVDLRLHFIADESASGFSSLHGQPEVEEDLRQVCAMSKVPEKFFDYLKCVDETYLGGSTDGSKCLDATGVAPQISACASGGEGKALLRENIKRAKELTVTSSPTFYLNGTRYSGGRDERSLTRAICGIIPGNPVCKNLPLEPLVNLIVLNDKNCVPCVSTSMVQNLRQLFSNLSVKEIDYGTEEGKQFAAGMKVKAVPAYFFDDSVKKHELYANIERYLQPNGDYLQLRVEATKLIERAETPKSLDLFVMSECPYGVQAEIALAEVAAAMPELNWSIHFIASKNADGSFSSLHGQLEVEEDLRQACIMERYDKAAYLEYLVCVDKDYQAGKRPADSWEECAKNASISVSQIKACANGTEGAALLSENMKLPDEVGASASPTFLLNNQILFNALTAADIQSNVCGSNQGLSGCEKQLSGGAAAGGAGAVTGGCGG